MVHDETSPSLPWKGLSPNPRGHILTDADRRKGGARKPSDSWVNSIKNRKKCNTKCPMFEVCPLMPLSISKANVGSACLLNKGGNALIRRFINLMVKGEEGLINEISNTLYLYANDIEVAPPSIKKDYANMCLQLHRQLYADKERAMEMKPQLTVVINEMGRDRVITPVLERGSIRLDSETNEYMHDLITTEKAHFENLTDREPDSLLNSPIIADIIEGKVHVQKSNYRTEDDEPARTEGKPKELAQPPGSPEDGT